MGVSLRYAMAGLSLWAVTAHAATVWDETAPGYGDLANEGAAPTLVTMIAGSNVVKGHTGNSGDGVDRDYFKFTVPPGAKLTSIMLLGNTSVSGGVSFIGIQSGPQVTVTPSGGGVENLIALGHYGNDQIGTDLLPAIKIGMPVELSSGTYSVWVQDTGGPASYGFDFLITGGVSVPTLPEWGMFLMAMLLMLIAACISKSWGRAPPRL